MLVREIAQLLQGVLHGEGEHEIRGVAALERAGPDDLSFAEGDRALARATVSRAGCILIAKEAPPALTANLRGQTTIAVGHPKLACVRAAEALRPAVRPAAGIHPTALVAPGAQLAAGVSVGPYVVIERGVTVGARTRLGAGVVLGEGAVVGAECVLEARVVVYSRARLGNRVVLHAGVVIGSDGFGYVLAEGRQHKFPQLGQTILEDDVEIGANSTVNRGSLGDTRIGEGTKIDNLVQIAHNVKIGRHCVIAAQTGISGSAEIGDYVVLAGQVGIGDKARIEDGAQIGGQAGILPGKVIRKGSTMWGTPARPLAEFKRVYARLSSLSKFARTPREPKGETAERQP
jgi:UDP-3-O-[3-hydroxymyristoyl] glucosamine N-acyltransferase